jgi:HAMP domain-containing protein
MSTPAEATAKTTPDQHWIDLVAEMLPEDRRLAWYRDLSPWLRSLPPEDEFGRIAYAMGFLALLIREMPPQLAEERIKYAELGGQLTRELNATLKNTAAYHQKLEQRLSQLSAEFAQGVKPELIAKKMSESFRQQIAQTGLDDTGKALSILAQQLRKSIGEFDQALQPITDRYRSLGSTVENETNRIVQATGRLRQETERLLTQTRDDRWFWKVLLLVVVLAGGFVLGLKWESNNASTVLVDLEQQVQQLQQKLDAKPAATLPLPKHGKTAAR